VEQHGKKTVTEATSTDPASGDLYRPQLHYTAADTWINDPNGLVYTGGMYHLFYQTNPYGTDHANMSWGHAVSTDLLHWRDRPLAIWCDDDEQIYSGSAVVDESNTSGFGVPGTAPLVAIYTSAYTDTSQYPGIQAQSLAYSLDDGETWTKYKANPVLTRHSSDFRDPKVFRYNGATTAYWVMAAVEAADQKVVFYRSDDLTNWTYLSQFESSTPVGRMWECPDLFPLAVDGDPTNTKWVLIVNLGLGDAEGGSAAVFFIGDFDGTCFTAAGAPNPGPGEQPEWEWLDHGRDYYATVSFNDAPDGRRILLGWMSNWAYASKLPTPDWRGAMALPREASLHSHRRRTALRQNVVLGLEPSGPTHALGRRDIPGGVHRLPIPCRNEPHLLEATFAAGSSTEFGLILRQSAGEGTAVGYDTVREELILDRTESGDVDFSPYFPVKDRAPVQLVDGRLRLKVYLDMSSVEVFAQDGLVTITDQIFPSPTSVGLSLYSVDGVAQLISLKVRPLKGTPIVRLEHQAPHV
jgi:fructan beta-fructosidase